MVTQDMTPFMAAVAEQAHRLARALPRLEDVPQAAAVRFAARKLRRELEAAGVTFMDLTGQPYDPGFAVEILETRGPANAVTHVIAEMIAPIMVWNGAVLRRGEVVLAGVAPAKQRCGWAEALRRKRRRRRRTPYPPAPSHNASRFGKGRGQRSPR